mmetsp:Transcript_10971/g.19614  ORF Transcript_10971/g.19614 Transcript_10971/m.19614 type:complete len:89 (+) Transcript_10971:244-510(+)
MNGHNNKEETEEQDGQLCAAVRETGGRCVWLSLIMSRQQAGDRMEISFVAPNLNTAFHDLTRRMAVKRKKRSKWIECCSPKTEGQDST